MQDVFRKGYEKQDYFHVFFASQSLWFNVHLPSVEASSSPFLSFYDSSIEFFREKEGEVLWELEGEYEMK
jgi:hypothetical protein